MSENVVFGIVRVQISAPDCRLSKGARLLGVVPGLGSAVHLAAMQNHDAPLVGRSILFAETSDLRPHPKELFADAPYVGSVLVHDSFAGDDRVVLVFDGGEIEEPAALDGWTGFGPPTEPGAYWVVGEGGAEECVETVLDEETEKLGIDGWTHEGFGRIRRHFRLADPPSGSSR